MQSYSKKILSFERSDIVKLMLQRGFSLIFLVVLIVLFFYAAGFFGRSFNFSQDDRAILDIQKEWDKLAAA